MTAAPRPPEAGGKRDSVLLITVNRLRAANLSLYGYPVRTTPRIADFAKQATLYSRAYTVSPWQLPSHASLFTGLYPSEHGAHRQTPDDPRPSLFYAYPLSETFQTLAERASDAGYRTAAYVGTHYGPMHPQYGLSQGFSLYWQGLRPSLLTRPHLAGRVR